MSVPVLTLKDGRKIPMLGLGTWPLSNEQAEQATGLAIEAGYRLVDTASRYGNEAGVGRAIRGSGVPRDQLFITTKLRGADHGYEPTLRAFEASRARLGLDYIDLYLIHWPLPMKDRYVESWRAMIKLQEDGVVRSIGVSNFRPRHIERLLIETGVGPVIDQVELHPELAQPTLRSFNKRHGIATEAWSPLGRGETLRDPTIAAIAKDHDKSPAQIVLRWLVELRVIAIPKSENAERIRENIALFDFALTPADRERLGALDRGVRFGGDPDTTDEE